MCAQTPNSCTGTKGVFSLVIYFYNIVITQLSYKVIIEKWRRTIYNYPKFNVNMYIFLKMLQYSPLGSSIHGS